jgi:hypothetical protein
MTKMSLRMCFPESINTASVFPSAERSKKRARPSKDERSVTGAPHLERKLRRRHEFAAKSASNIVAKIRIFLEIQRPSEPLKRCWSIPLEGMDDLGMETFERLRTQLLDENSLETSERICRIHIRNDGPPLEGVQTEFIMEGQSRAGRVEGHD